jgi:ABC-type Fe3+/spermidine/putrescine transport system ATPase subunit
LDKILVRDLTKTFPTRYGAVAALEHLDLAVREGEFFVLLGPSGCGKTTLIRIISVAR